MNLETIKLVYFIGIGGIGMSAIARYFHQLGAEVHGYDRTATRLTRTLEAEGIHIHYTEDVTMVPQNIDLVVYTPAVPSTHAELVFLREQNLPIMKRAEVLGLISQNRKTLAVAGTHGKTSTSTILAHLLRSGGVEAAAFLGGIALNYGSNFIPGQSEWVVVEADEYDRSFLHLHPECAVVLSADADHLDIYGDHATMLETGFRAFLKLVKRADGVWVQTDVMKYFPNLKVKAFGLENGAAYADNIRVENGRFHFDYVGPKAVLRDLSWQHPGRHNVENAVAAITLALEAEADPEGIRAGLSSFLGIRRRYEQLVRRDDLVLINDYAHHPTELKATIDATRELFPERKITGVFQPHLFSRTQDFAPGFAEALDRLDTPILLPIYPAREEPIPGVTSELILNQMTNKEKSIIAKERLIAYLTHQDIDVLLLLGAGDIDALVPDIINQLSP